MSHALVRSRNLLLAVALCLAILLAGCGAPTTTATSEESEPAGETTATSEESKPAGETTVQATEEETTVNGTMKLYIGEIEVPVSWLENESVAALKELAKGGLTIEASMHGGFEQYGPLGADLPRNDKETVTAPGDIVLYSGNQIVVFYGTNTWRYTRLGHVALSQAELTDLLANGNVRITLQSE